jgi:hypothetical protein
MYKKRLKIKPIIQSLRAGDNIYDACTKAKISYRGFKKWQDNNPRLFHLVEIAKDDSENKRIKKVEASLYKRALGYKYREVTIERDIKNPKIKIQKVIIKELAPDPTAALFFLMNRAPERWADKRALVNNYNVIKNTVNPLGKLADEDLNGIIDGFIRKPESIQER